MKPLFLFCILIFMGCKSDAQPEEVEKQEKSYVLAKEDIEKFDYKDFVLSDASKLSVMDWQKFQDLQVNLDLLFSANLSFFKVEKRIMEEFIAELKKEQPESVKTPAVRSRITVLETNLLRLQDLANLDNIKKQELLAAVEELLIANANLKLQINKKFEKEAQQIQLPVHTD